ncbi:MAG: hypothetical protein VXY07_15925 [Planctomycetota bacterium]|nr:hypothetical protein [Planctomycetota bacterium]MEC8784321.1 hypothetical protein [Planctomycetota bacterium]
MLEQDRLSSAIALLESLGNSPMMNIRDTHKKGMVPCVFISPLNIILSSLPNIPLRVCDSSRFLNPIDSRILAHY